MLVYQYNAFLGLQVPLFEIELKLQTNLMMVQTPLGAMPGLETQPLYEAPGDLRVDLVENAVINIELVRLSPPEWPKVGRGTAK